MQVQNNYPQNSFKSTIRLVNPIKFMTDIRKIYRQEVTYPWTINESKIAKGAYTFRVCDCGVVGITNGKEVLLMHICPTMKENFDFKKIENFILEKINFLRNSFTQGFVLGGIADVPESPKSIEYINNYCNIFERENIPFSKFKGGNSERHVAYFTENDTWLICNGRAESLNKMYHFTPFEAAKQIFDDVQLCELDEIKWQ